MCDDIERRFNELVCEVPHGCAARTGARSGLFVAVACMGFSGLLGCDEGGRGKSGTGSDTASLPARNPPGAIVNSIGIGLRLIPAGSFVMGSPPNEAAPPVFKAAEKQHLVTLECPFYISTTEVTNEQFARFLRESGYAGGARGKVDLLKHLTDEEFADMRGDEKPVVFVSWHDAMAFCKWLGERERAVYRLPSEEEWEYVCRSGTDKTYGCTSDEKELLEYAWMKPNSGGKTHEVGTRKSNAWAVFDMNGNVWEWTATHIPRRQTRETFPGKECAVIRGGGYFNTVNAARCAGRWGAWPIEHRNHGTGFRVVREVSAIGATSTSRPRDL